MLPSKGYFKSLNCPYFLTETCNRPHCHFRHTKKDKTGDENQQLEDADHSNQIPDGLSDVVEDTSSDNVWPSAQQSTSSSISYKPTPIVELKKRHIPITTAPSVTLSSTSQKRRIEYDVKGIKKPKVIYVPEAVNSESNLSSKYPTNVTSTVYRATKICDNSEQSLNGDNAPVQDNEESEGEIDFDQVSTELDFLDEILKEYEKPPSLLNESNLKEVVQNSQEKEEIKSKSELFNDKVNNGLLKHNQVPVDGKSRNNSTESDCNDSNKAKKHKEYVKKERSDTDPNERKSENDSSKNIDKHRKKSSTSTSSSSKGESKSSSEHRRKSVDHHKSEKDREKRKSSSEKSSSSKTTKRESGNDSAFDKLLKSDSSNSVKHSKKEHGSSSNTSSNKNHEHKSSSRTLSRKDSEKESSSNKSSVKDSDHKHSSKSHRKESDHHSKSSKSSKTDSRESQKKRTHSTESHSSSKKHKNESNTDHKHDDNRKSSKYKDESRHRKESNEKRNTKDDKPSRSKEHRKKETCDTKHSEKQKRAHSVSEESSDDVEIISESGSIIIIDSEDDSDSPLHKKSKMEEIENSPSSSNDSRGASPVFPSDVSVTSDVGDNEQDRGAGTMPETSAPIKKTQDDASLLDHRVQSRLKTRVSLGNAYRPPVRKPAQIMTPAERLKLFAMQKQREQQENEGEQSVARVKIGCVPNVKHLLEEKERLLKASNRSQSSGETKPKSTLRVDAQVFKMEDQDIVPDAPIGTKHPRSRGADLFTRRTMLEKLYKYQKQLLEPNRPFREAREKCLQDESKIWYATNHDSYEREMQLLIERRKAEIPKFTLRYFPYIRPKQSTMFPPELRKKKNGVGETTPTSEESLYTWLLKYCLSDEELETEGYPRKKDDPSGRLIAYINHESLSRWKKAQGVPPSGELACFNCSKFYSVDENGLSVSRWECHYHAKKSWKTLKDKSGLLEKKARCCGNDLGNPCMSSEYHSTETRDMQNLLGFMETKDPSGEMPPEGWGVYALDCEMYWSTRGSELGRVTVVNVDQRTVYDTFVRPEFTVTDYTTRMSGLTKENLESAGKTFAQVQKDLMKLFNSKTILIGHSLENDLKALQIIHNVVVDTAMVFKKGEYKQALKILAEKVLNEVIQNEEDGHDSAEDAVTCIKLMLHKVTKDAIALSRRAPPAPRGRYRPNNPMV